MVLLAGILRIYRPACLVQVSDILLVNLNRSPTGIAKVEIERVTIPSDTNMDSPFRGIVLCLRLDDIER
jgi:hypothetical protein